jgi:hypothetical protein
MEIGIRIYKFVKKNPELWKVSGVYSDRWGCPSRNISFHLTNQGTFYVSLVSKEQLVLGFLDRLIIKRAFKNWNKWKAKQVFKSVNE